MNKNRHLLAFLPVCCLLAACAGRPPPGPETRAVTAALPVDEPALVEPAPEAPATPPPGELEAGDPDLPLIVIPHQRPLDTRPPTLGESVLRLAGFPGPGTYFARAAGLDDYEPNFLLGEGPLTPWGRYLLEANPYIGRDRPTREMKLAIQGLETRGLTPCDVGEDFMNPHLDPLHR
jgi:hypothetical protein